VPFTGNADDERRRLEDIARTGLEPRIRNLQTRAVPLAEGGAVIIVRVPRSYAPPHRVIYKNRSRFWARASSGKYEPNVEELRHIFTEAPRIAERIAAFRTDQIVRITAGETPIPLGPGGKVVLHVVPVPAFADGRLLDVVSAVAAGTHVPLPLDGMGLRRMLDGAVPGWDEAVDWSLLLERQSFLVLVVSICMTLLFLLLRAVLAWYADSRLRIPRFHLREHALRAGVAFFSTPEIKR